MFLRRDKTIHLRNACVISQENRRKHLKNKDIERICNTRALICKHDLLGNETDLKRANTTDHVNFKKQLYGIAINCFAIFIKIKYALEFSLPKEVRVVTYRSLR